MTSRERLILFAILLTAMLLLPLTIKAATEDEMVANFIAKTELKRPHRLFAPFLTVSFGKTDPKGYKNFVQEMNEYVKHVDGSDAFSGISGITGFEGGFSVVSDRSILSFSFNYWLNAGSSKHGDFRVSPNLWASAYEEYNDFTFRSEIKVWGVLLDYQYFLYNHPIPYAAPKGISVRAGGGIGYYGAFWYLWDGFGGYISDSGEFYELEDHLTGTGPGYHASAGIEYPILSGFVFAVDAKYLWLEFDKLSKQISSDIELYLLEEENGGPVKFDFSGPRINLSIKRYFTF